ncbi:glycoside hydrolase family 28 protein [Peniophora sp. CONT]|nr:glycoside hydrolase family 28 protein [Peniophora sp. CONT]
MQSRALSSFVLVALASVAVASPTGTSMAKRATCTVSSVASAADLSSCSAVVIEAFSVPSGSVVTIAAAKGATVTMQGSVSFSKTTASGPLITIDTDDVTFNGNGYSFKGNGDLYWDGEGTNGGVTKPHPFVKFKGYGTFTDFIVKNSPAQAISIGTTGGSAVFSDVLVDNADGDTGSLGHNTDGFDVSASDVTIKGSTVYNQDDCIAINSGSTLVFENNYCSGGHGISIGSIADAKTVSGVTISGNTVVKSMYGMRIKVDSDATGSVSGVTYSGNSIAANQKYGFLISQSYSTDFGTPGTSSTVSGINFTGSKTTVTTTGSYPRVGVDCGKCTGTWDWSELVATGGEASDIVLAGGVKISGGSY